MIVPGGAKEALFCASGSGAGDAGSSHSGAGYVLKSPTKRMRFFLRQRKGFVKVALENGATLVPCVVFEENFVYRFLHVDEESVLGRVQSAFHHMTKTIFGTSVSLPIFWGNGIFGWMPLRQPLNVFVGAGVSCRRADGAGAVTQEEIDAKHAEYMTALHRVFDENKARVGFADWELDLV